MTFSVRVSRPANSAPDHTWTVRVADAAGKPIGVDRPLSVVEGDGDPVWRFPRAAPDDTLTGDENKLNRADASVRDIGRIYGGVAAGAPPDLALRFGRYLFHTLLGADTWAAILAAAGPEPIALSLSWPDDAWELTRLPWELMHDGAHFVATAPLRLVTIERAITPQVQSGESLLRPRVLFVIGSPLSDAEIRAGSEFIGLMRRLHELCLQLDCRVLVAATPNGLKAAMQAFQPSIVHFIAHGEVDQAGGSLRLRPDDANLKVHNATADQLLRYLAVTDASTRVTRLPAIVILNACFAATQIVPDADGPTPQDFPIVGGERGSLPTKPQARPLAAALVRGDAELGGIPLVVGMGGKVSDLACRLFTRRFYEALLTGAPATAAAEGRRKAYEHSADVQQQMDWAVPAIFVAEGTTFTVDQAEWDRAARREGVCRNFQGSNDPPAFCGRLAFFEHHGRLLSPAPTGAPERVLAIYESRQPSDDAKYGRKRLLQELAVHTVRTGHVPILVKLPDRALTTPYDIARAFVIEGAKDTCGRFGVAEPNRDKLQIVALSAHLENPRKRLDKRVQSELKYLGETAAWRMALAIDLAALRTAIVDDLYKDDEEGKRRVQLVVIAPDIHLYGSGASVLIDKFVNADGLGLPGEPIPFIFSFKKERAEYGFETVFEKLHKFVSDRPNYLIAEELGQLDPPKDDRSLYLHYLLNRKVDKPPVVPRTALSAIEVEQIFTALHENINRTPSKLASRNGELAAVIQAFIIVKQLVTASDDQLVAQLKGR
jgi:hypothetical protein